MRLIDKIFAISLFIFISVVNNCFAQESSPFRGKINADNINIRSNSTINSEIICKVDKGDYVDVVLQLYDWYKIKLPKSAPVFIKKSLVVLLDERKPNPSTQNQTARVLKDRVNVRLHPNDSSAIIGRADAHEIVSVVGEQGQWYKILPVDNSYGWIHKKFVEKVTVAEKQENSKLIDKVSQEEKTKDTVILEGIIKPYGKVFKRPATHKLFTQDNKVFLLKGNKRSLDTLNYCKVRITGKIIPSPREKIPIIEIEKMEILD